MPYDHPVKPGEDPFINLPPGDSDLVEATQTLTLQYTEYFQQLSSRLNLNLADLKHLLVFGPGLCETQALIMALQDQGVSPDQLTLDLVEADPNVLSRIKQQALPATLRPHNQTFADFLQQPSCDPVNLAIIANTGPVTCKPGVGFTPENTPVLVSLLQPAGLVATRGEVHDLIDYLDSNLIPRFGFQPSQSAYTPGFSCWQKPDNRP